jgi:UDP-N-acetylglucosamine--N-acetylmuramyl-(pentapeptide) pyrophosphoryl-undecaprenol N-acetylglucosamine transferase
MRWIIAGGGTGGHLYPGIAIAHELKRKVAGADVLFVGHGRGLASDILSREGFAFEEIKMAGIKGQSIGGSLVAMLRLLPALWQSGRIISRFSPHAVLGVGGYSAGPVVLSAALMKKACYIQEQNVYPGLTNRALADWVRKIFTSYKASAEFFPADKVLFTGNPVRREVIRLPDKMTALQNLGLKVDRFTVLVFGGSQGAHRINGGMIEALPYLLPQREGLQVVHQTGERDYAEVKAAYEQRGIGAHVSPFIYDMPEAYAAADMLICRAGATTLAEITTAGKPALLIPYPYAANDHQRKNAEVLAEAGAARVMNDREVSGEGLGRVILELMADRERLEQMAKKAKELGRPDAARRIVEYILAELEHAGQN